MAHRLICIALAALWMAVSLQACADRDRVQVDAGPVKDLRLSTVWEALAVDGRFDGETALLESLLLQYSDICVLRSARFQAWTDGPRLLQVGFNANDRAGEEPVRIGGPLSPIDPAVASVAFGDMLPLVAQVFRAIDLVGPESMIKLLPPSGYDGIYAFISAYEMTSPLQPISPSATVYLWDESCFTQVAAYSNLREFAGGYEYLVGSTAKLASSTSSDGVISKAWEGSGEPVYFVIPAPRL